MNLILAQEFYLSFTENMVTQELEAHNDMQRLAAFEVLPRYKTNELVSAFLLTHHTFLIKADNNENNEPYVVSARSLKTYKKELNFKVLILTY